MIKFSHFKYVKEDGAPLEDMECKEPPVISKQLSVSNGKEKRKFKKIG